MPARAEPNDVQVPFTGADTVIDVAVTLPDVSAGPIAVAHCPTTTALASAFTVFVYAVEASTVIVALLVVHALSDRAKQFYLGCGFKESPLDPLTLMVRVKDLGDARGQ